MKTEDIYNVLLDKGYNELQAKRLCKDLSELSPNLAKCFDVWARDGEENDFSSHGLSVKGLIAKYSLKYPAALLSMDWVVKEPDKAVKVINRGIR